MQMSRVNQREDSFGALRDASRKTYEIEERGRVRYSINLVLFKADQHSDFSAFEAPTLRWPVVQRLQSLKRLVKDLENFGNNNEEITSLRVIIATYGAENLG